MPPATGIASVITSYSIHYTKLYDSYEALGLLSFFTVGADEVRAWTVRDGALAPEAAGTIHSDLERGFIRAEVISYEDLMKVGVITSYSIHYTKLYEKTILHSADSPSKHKFSRKTHFGKKDESILIRN